MLLLWIFLLSWTWHPIRQKRLQGKLEYDHVCHSYLHNRYFIFHIDLQVLPVQVPQELQEEEEPAQGQVDQGFQEERRQGIGCGSGL